MIARIDSFQAIKGNVRIDLCGRDIGVAKNGLNGAQVGAISHHVRGAAMTKSMRAGVRDR